MHQVRFSNSFFYNLFGYLGAIVPQERQSVSADWYAHAFFSAAKKLWNMRNKQLVLWWTRMAKSRLRMFCFLAVLRGQQHHSNCCGRNNCSYHPFVNYSSGFPSLRWSFEDQLSQSGRFFPHQLCVYLFSQEHHSSSQHSLKLEIGRSTSPRCSFVRVIGPTFRVRSSIVANIKKSQDRVRSACSCQYGILRQLF